MATKAVLVKRGPAFYPATPADQEEADLVKQGESVNAILKSKKARSYQFHKLYFGGLLELASAYWQPKGGLMSKDEKDFANGLVQYAASLDVFGGDQLAGLKTLIKGYADDLITARKAVVPSIRNNKDELHQWVKEEAGYYDWEVGPNGLRKKLQSISFDDMDDKQFNKFYKAAHTVVWNQVLMHHFKNETEADNAIQQLISMG